MDHGVHLDGGDDDHLAAFLDRYEEKELDDPATAMRIIEQSLRTDLDTAILDAVTGRDADASRLARRRAAEMPAHVAHACAFVGPRGVDPHVCLAIAPLLEHVDLKATDGPFPGAALVWHDGFTVWTPDGANGAALGIRNDGTVVVDAVLPQSVVETLPGRRLRDVVTHAMVAEDPVILSAAWSTGRLEIKVGPSKPAFVNSSIRGENP